MGFPPPQDRSGEPAQELGSGVSLSAAAASSVQVPNGADPDRYLDELAVMRRAHKRRRQRMGFIVVLMLLPGLAFPMLGRKSSRSSSDKTMDPTCRSRCVSSCAVEVRSPRGPALWLDQLCFDSCLAACEG